MQNRFAALLIAALLPLLLFKWFIPVPYGQIDVWLMWMGAMISIGLPLLYAEIALAQRSRAIPAQGMQELTRQADASTLWRGFAWLSVALALVIAALSIDAVSAHFLNSISQMGLTIDVPTFALAIVMVVVAGMLSLLGRRTLIAALALIGLAFMVAFLSNLSLGPSITAWGLTGFTLAEWARVVVMALVSVGVATGLYWFSSPHVTQIANADTKQAATKLVTPIWFTQLAIGSIVFLLGTTNVSPIATLIYSLGVMAAAAFLIHYASTQLAIRFSRFGIWIATILSMVITIGLVVIATPSILTMVLTAVSITSALMLAIFVGWKMKISHMRKSLNFKTEGLYNLWRVAIRIITPLLIVVAIVGWFY